MLDAIVRINHMVDGHTGESVEVPSTVLRELFFVAHHGIHHAATIKSLILHHHGNVAAAMADGTIGRAPSTVYADNPTPKS